MTLINVCMAMKYEPTRGAPRSGFVVSNSLTNVPRELLIVGKPGCLCGLVLWCVYCREVDVWICWESIGHDISLLWLRWLHCNLFGEMWSFILPRFLHLVNFIISVMLSRMYLERHKVTWWPWSSGWRMYQLAWPTAGMFIHLFCYGQ